MLLLLLLLLELLLIIIIIISSTEWRLHCTHFRRCELANLHKQYEQTKSVWYLAWPAGADKFKSTALFADWNRWRLQDHWQNKIELLAFETLRSIIERRDKLSRQKYAANTDATALAWLVVSLWFCLCVCCEKFQKQGKRGEKRKSIKGLKSVQRQQ